MRTNWWAFSPNDAPGMRANFSSSRSCFTKSSLLSPVLDISASRNIPDCGIIGSTLFVFFRAS